MAQVADYIVLRDSTYTIRRSSSPPEGEMGITITLPNDVVLDDPRHSVLMFMVRAPRGNIVLEVDVNARRVLNATTFNDPNVRAFHEVVDTGLLRPGSPNDFLFRVVDGPPTAELVVSDVILWFQRDALGSGEPNRR